MSGAQGGAVVLYEGLDELRYLRRIRGIGRDDEMVCIVLDGMRVLRNCLFLGKLDYIYSSWFQFPLTTFWTFLVLARSFFLEWKERCVFFEKIPPGHIWIVGLLECMYIVASIY